MKNYELNQIIELLNISNYDEDDERLKPYIDELNYIWSRYFIYNYEGKTYYIPRAYYENPEQYIKSKYF